MTDIVETQRRRKIIRAGLIGNLSEWYDFAIYGYFITVISPQFFPSDNPTVSLLAAFGAFAAGFLVRPLGAIVFGYIGDKLGRSRALTISIWAMAIPTVLIGMLPNYEAIGVLAPILIILFRVVQGLSVGGEFTSSIIFLVERAEPDRRSRTGSWSKIGATGGILLGAATGALLSSVLTETQIAEWGWRVPFFLGALTGLVGVYLRRQVADEEQAAPPQHSPIKDTFRRHWRLVLTLMAMKIALTVGYYTAFVYGVTYVRDVSGLPNTQAYEVNVLAMFILLLMLPVMATLADKIGRRPMLLVGSGTLVFGAVPFFMLMNHSDPALILLGEIGFAFGVAAFSAGSTATVVEITPPEVRCTIVALSHNLAAGLFGGTTPLIATWMLSSTGDPLAPGYWVAAASAISFITILVLIPETRQRPLFRATTQAS
ncbi:MAG: MFS transporter [Pseudomonadota bacterium]